MGWQRDHCGRVAGRSLPKRGVDPWEKSQLALDKKGGRTESWSGVVVKIEAGAKDSTGK